MSTVTSQEDTYKLVQDKILKLETKAKEPTYHAGAIKEDKIILLDQTESNIQIYNRLNGRHTQSIRKMESLPVDVCTISKTTAVVCLENGYIILLSFDSMFDVKEIKSFDARTGINNCLSMAKLNSDRVIVSGVNNDSMFCWSIVSITDGTSDSLYNICKRNSKAYGTFMAFKHSTVYISCFTSDPKTNGVYAFEMSNRYKAKFVYQHDDFKFPSSIIADKDYVCVSDNNSIHQITHSGELLAIHQLSSIIYGMFYDKRYGDIYTTREHSNELSLYTMAKKETVCNVHIIVVGPLNVGKTSLVKRILGERAIYSDRHSGDGIDVISCHISPSSGEWTIQIRDSEYATKQSKDFSSKQKEDTSSALGQPKKLLTIWDFPGCYSFNPNHLTFLTMRTIYLLVFNLSDHKGLPDKVHEIVDAGLNSMYSSSKEAKIHPVILVGTNVDKLSKGERREICEKYFEEIRSYVNEKAKRFCLIDEDYPIDNTTADSNLEELKRKIVEVASKMPYWDEKIPDWWLPLEQKVMRLKANGVKVISPSDLTKMDKRAESEQLESVTKYLISNGTILPGRSSEKLELDRNLINDAVESLGLDRTKETSDRRHTELSAFDKTGILTSEFIGDLWKKNHPELFDNREVIIQKLEHIKFIARPMEFSIEGEKDFSECLLPIFDKLSAACVARWPPGKTETSENLIFQGGCICSIDLFHRLILHCKKHVMYVRIIIKEDDKAKTLDAKKCSRVKWFITSNLRQIAQDVKYNLHSQPLFKDGSGASFRVWCEDEEWDLESFMTRENMNYSRLCVAIVTACANALRKVLLTNVNRDDNDLYKSLKYEKSRKLKKRLNEHQIRLAYPDRKGNDPVRLCTFDIPLLYILITNISKVVPPKTGWGTPQSDKDWDNSLGASVERIHIYRNKFVGHPTVVKIENKTFVGYWKNIERTLFDIKETVDKAKPAEDKPEKANDKTEQTSDKCEKEIDKFMEQFQKQSMQVKTVYDDC